MEVPQFLHLKEIVGTQALELLGSRGSLVHRNAVRILRRCVNWHRPSTAFPEVISACSKARKWQQVPDSRYLKVSQACKCLWITDKGCWKDAPSLPSIESCHVFLDAWRMSCKDSWWGLGRLGRLSSPGLPSCASSEKEQAVWDTADVLVVMG